MEATQAVAEAPAPGRILGPRCRLLFRPGIMRYAKACLTRVLPSKIPPSKCQQNAAGCASGRVCFTQYPFPVLSLGLDVSSVCSKACVILALDIAAHHYQRGKRSRHPSRPAFGDVIHSVNDLKTTVFQGHEISPGSRIYDYGIPGSMFATLFTGLLPAVVGPRAN